LVAEALRGEEHGEGAQHEVGDDVRDLPAAGVDGDRAEHEYDQPDGGEGDEDLGGVDERPGR